MGTLELAQLWSKLNDVVTEGDEEIFVHEIEYDSLLVYDKKIINIINIILNSLICLSCVYVFKLSWWLMPVAFIIADVMLSALEFIIVFIQNKKTKIILKDVESISNYIIKLEKERKLYESKYLESEMSDMSKRVRNYRLSQLYRKKCSIIRTKIEKLEQIKVAQEKEQEKALKKEEVFEEDMQISKADKAIKGYKEIVRQVEQEGYIDTRILNVINVSKILLNEVEKNKVSYSIVTNIFNIYLVELIETMKEVEKLSEVHKNNYTQKINTLIDNYYYCVEKAIEQVKGYNIMDIDVRINTLLSELNKVGDK